MGVRGLDDPAVRCPYYRCDLPLGISCEGAYGGSVIQQRFIEKRSVKLQKARFCCNAWEECRVAQMLTGKYQEE